MPNYRFDKDEFDLKEYAKVILKRKRTIFNIILICVIIAAIVRILTPETSEVYAIVRIGTISKPIISKKQAIYEIRSKEIIDSVIEVLKLEPYAYNFNNMISSEEIDGTDLIKIKVRHTDLLADRICSAIANTFVAKNTFVYNKVITLLEKDIEKIKARRFVADAERLFSLEQDLATAKNFAVIEKSSILPFSFWLGLGSKIAVAAISGLMLGLLVIFMQEFLGRGQGNVFP